MVGASGEQQHVLPDRRGDVECPVLRDAPEEVERRTRARDLHALLDAPTHDRTAPGRPGRHPVHATRGAKPEEQSQRSPHRPPGLSQDDVEKIRHRVEGDDPRHSRFRCGRTQRETSAERQADQRDPLDAEMIEHRADRHVPLRGQRQTIAQRTTLPRTVERDHVVTSVAEIDERRRHLLDVAVEAAEQNDRASRPGRREPVGRQLSDDLPMMAIRYREPLPQLGPVPRRHCPQEPVAGVLARRIVSAHEELRRPPVKAGPEHMPLFKRPLGEPHELARPVLIRRNAWRGRRHLFEHGRLADTSEPPVHLEVQARVRMRAVIADGKRHATHRCGRTVGRTIPARTRPPGQAREPRPRPGATGAVTARATVIARRLRPTPPAASHP